MALGDKWIDCSAARLNLGWQSIFRMLLVNDGSDNPAVRVYQINPSSGSGSVVPVQRTTGITRASTSSSVAAGKMKVSISNVGSADGSVKGVALKPGETVNFEAGNYDTLDAITYNGTGTELLITTVE